MKKIALFLSMAVLAMACEKPISEPKITAPDEVSIPVEGTEEVDVFVEFNSTAAWTASLKEASDWCLISPDKGEAGDAKVKVIATASDSKDPRVATLVITAGVTVKEVSLVQGYVPAFDIVETEKTVGPEGGKVSFEFQTNLAFEATLDPSCTWARLVSDSKAYESHTISVEVDPFDELDGYRETSVTVNLGDDVNPRTLYIYQDGPSSVKWYCNPTDYSAYTADSKVRLAKYGEYLLLSNGTKVLVLNPADGTLVNTINLPEGYNIQSLCVDEGNHILAAADAAYGSTLTIFRLDDISKIDPKVLLTFDTANYYGVDCGNVRVKGDVTKNAVVTAVVSDGAGGAVLYWEISNGTIQEGFSYVAPPYAGSTVTGACGVALGTKASDGFLYIGYGGDYNLYYYNGSAWSVCYTTGSAWMENYNCIATADFKGKKYAAIVKGCHFDYDATDVVLLDVTDPTKAEEVMIVDCDSWVDRSEAWANLDWTGAGAYSDVLLVPGENELNMFFVDANFNVIGSVMYK